MNLRSLLFLLMCLPFVVKAQSNQHRVYEPNIVRLESDQFGLIIGEAEGHLYFITAGRQESAFEQDRTATLYLGKAEVPAKFIRSFSFGQGIVLLYDVATDKKPKWRNAFFTAKRNFSGTFQSFLPETRLAGKADKNNWFASNAPFEKNSSSAGLTEMRTVIGTAVFRGMPVIDFTNSVAGLTIDEQSQDSPAPVVSVISLFDIADRFYNWNKCKYFQMVEYGQPGTRCELEDKATAGAKQLEAQARRQNQIQAIAVGPGFSAGLPAISTYGTSSTAGGSVYGLGFNLETAPDKGAFHVTFKPRINFVTFNIKEPLDPKSKIGFTPTKYSWTSYEIPIMLEFLFSRSIGGNNYWGVGYIPGQQSDVNYRYTTSTQNSEQKAVAAGTKAFTHKVTAVIGAEIRSTRIELFTTYQLAGVKDPPSTTIQGTTLNPLYGLSDKYFVIGIDLSFRLNGKWGLKSVAADK